MVRIPKKKGGIFRHFSGKMCRLFKMIQASSIRRKAYVRDSFIRKHYINMDMASKSGINTFFFLFYILESRVRGNNSKPQQRIQSF